MKTCRERHPNMRVDSLNFDHDTWAMVEEMAPNRKAIAHFLAHLVYAEHARRQECSSAQTIEKQGTSSVAELTGRC